MIKKEHIGFHNGYKLWKITLTNSKGTEVALTNYGGAIMSVKTADKNGDFADVVLGYDDIERFFPMLPYRTFRQQNRRWEVYS